MKPVAWWGVAGVVAILLNAVVRMVPLVAELGDHSLASFERVVLVGWVAMMVVAEGYRGFHRQFSPRVVARALYLAAHPRPWLVVVAPLYCIGLVHATRRRLITSWILTLAITAIVIAVRRVAQPWRGIIDAGVVAGLGIGILSIGYFVVRASGGHPMPVPPDVPGATAT